MTALGSGPGDECFTGVFDGGDGSYYQFNLDGMYELLDGRWYFWPAGSSNWARVYKAALVERSMRPGAWPANAPPLRPPAEARPSGERNRKRAYAPFEVAAWFHADERNRTAIILLYEEGWESVFGEGRIYFLVGCFPTAADCDTWLEASAQHRHYGYHRRTVEFMVETGRRGYVFGLEPVDYEGHFGVDRFTLSEALHDLARRLAGKIKPTEPTHDTLD